MATPVYLKAAGAQMSMLESSICTDVQAAWVVVLTTGFAGLAMTDTPPPRAATPTHTPMVSTG